jgi:hypothetical protein
MDVYREIRDVIRGDKHCMNIMIYTDVGCKGGVQKDVVRAMTSPESRNILTLVGMDVYRVMGDIPRAMSSLPGKP